jgi:hypothetical protein
MKRLYVRTYSGIHIPYVTSYADNMPPSSPPRFPTHSISIERIRENKANGESWMQDLPVVRGSVWEHVRTRSDTRYRGSQTPAAATPHNTVLHCQRTTYRTVANPKSATVRSWVQKDFRFQFSNHPTINKLQGLLENSNHSLLN